MKTFKTEKGTELPLLDLRGKDYLQVAHRIRWFREEHPDWSIETEFVQSSPSMAIAKATIRSTDGKIMSTSHKMEDSKGFQDFHEKAETGAIGRALALIGYGTQFAPDLEEGERIVDSPIQKDSASVPGYIGQVPTPKPLTGSPGDYQIPYGKFKGATLKSVGVDRVRNDLGYWERTVKDSGDAPGTKLAEYMEVMKSFLATEGDFSETFGDISL